MSSFICSSKHFCSIENALNEILSGSEGYYLERNTGLKSKQDISKFVENLRWLNVVCVTFQYRSHYEGKMDAQISAELANVATKCKPKYLSLHGLYNALTCVDYQIETEHVKGLFDTQVSETMPLLKNLIDYLARQIVSKLPDDNTNNWSID